MAPVSKKAKLAASKPVAGGGLKSFFGGAKTANAAAPAEKVPPAAAPAPEPAKAEPPAAAPAPTSNGGLTDAQKQKIEENRRKAMEIRQAKLAKQNGGQVEKPQLQAAATANGRTSQPDLDKCQKSPSPSKPLTEKTLKRKGDDITPEKPSMPGSDRRIASVATPAESKFRTFGTVSWMQYNDLYTKRLEKLREGAFKQAKALWSSEVAAQNFFPTISSGLQSTGDVVMVGVTFKDMPSRNNVIEQYRDSSVATSCLPEEDVDKQPNLCSDADTLWLEDSSFRIHMKVSAEQVAALATGFVMAVRGQVTPDGKLDVKSTCMTQGLVSTPLAPVPQDAASSPRYLALLSGLFIGTPDENVELRNKALEFLLGRSSDSQQVRSVQHLVVCGGVYHVENIKDGPTSLDDADTFFAQLAEKMQVDVMPGHKDPSNLSLPQLPLHPYLFRASKKCSQFKSVSNPYQRNLDSLNILGHSGQPIRDLMRCSSISSPMQALTTCLDASLLAPTAPDTLITQSFDKTDPFVIESTPCILFSGGHEKVEYEWRAPADGSSGTLCVCVPAFSKQPAVVLVNMNNPRDIHVQEFSA